MRHIVICVIALAVLAGCSTDRPDEDFFAPGDVGTLVVDAALIVGKPFPDLLLTRAASPAAVALTIELGADVRVRIEPDGTIVTYSYGLSSGRYVPDDPAILVEPRTTYVLDVLTWEGEHLTATTTTPAPFSIDRWVLLDDAGETIQRTLRSFEELGENVYFADENQLVYAEGLLEARFARVDGAPGYHVGIFSLDLDSDFVIDPAFFEEDDFEDLERTLSSPAFEVPDGELRLPWFAIFFQGRYKLRVFAVDENWYQFLLTSPEFQNGFGGNIGDAFRRPAFNIEGGIGLFGSASVDSTGFFVLPRP